MGVSLFCSGEGDEDVDDADEDDEDERLSSMSAMLEAMRAKTACCTMVQVVRPVMLAAGTFGRHCVGECSLRRECRAAYPSGHFYEALLAVRL